MRFVCMIAALICVAQTSNKFEQLNKLLEPTGRYINQYDLELIKTMFPIVEEDSTSVTFRHPDIPGIWFVAREGDTTIRIIEAQDIKGLIVWCLWLLAAFMLGSLAEHYRLVSRTIISVHRIVKSIK